MGRGCIDSCRKTGVTCRHGILGWRSRKKGGCDKSGSSAKKERRKVGESRNRSAQRQETRCRRPQLTRRNGWSLSAHFRPLPLFFTFFWALLPRSFDRATRKSAWRDCLFNLSTIADFFPWPSILFNTLVSGKQFGWLGSPKRSQQPWKSEHTILTVLRASSAAEKWRENSAARRVDLAWKIISI